MAKDVWIAICVSIDFCTYWYSVIYNMDFSSLWSESSHVLTLEIKEAESEPWLVSCSLTVIIRLYREKKTFRLSTALIYHRYQHLENNHHMSIVSVSKASNSWHARICLVWEAQNDDHAATVLSNTTHNEVKEPRSFLSFRASRTTPSSAATPQYTTPVPLHTSASPYLATYITTSTLLDRYHTTTSSSI
jgi:hypothetical protein